MSTGTPPLHDRRTFLGARRSIAVATLAAFVAACGGGGDDGGASPAPAAAASAASAPASAPAAGSATAASTCNLPDFRAALLARINQLRAAGADCGSDGVFRAAASLAWNYRLTAAADAHSRDMAAQNYFSHTSADGRTFVDRINATGYAWTLLGENIAAGYATANAVMDGWIASPGHCANLMNPGFAEVGVACVPGTSADTYRSYWTMELGRPR
jgi:uncharacterized protein YkwD